MSMENTRRMRLRELAISGFKSVSGQGQTIALGDITVLLGANGAGKSNLLSFFSLLRAMGMGTFREHVGRYGADRLLFRGARTTQSIGMELLLDNGADIRYAAELDHDLGGGLFFRREHVRCARRARKRKTFRPTTHRLPDGSDVVVEGDVLDPGRGGESGLLHAGGATGRLIREFLAGIGIHQFNDTSELARMRDRCYVDDALPLRRDGSNLPAFLHMLENTPRYAPHWERILRHIRHVMPQFHGFALDPLPHAEDWVRLNWRDAAGDGMIFDPHQLSDGTLRFMALAAALLQPPELLPSLIVLDEPELGLHPAAIIELVAMLGIASQHAQILLATQSTRLVDEFDAENIVICEHDVRQGSVFRRLDGKRLGGWLRRYSLSELWEKNVLGGQP